MSEKTEKTLFCLIDGASWRVLRPLMEKENELLTTDIFESGASGHLDNLGEYKSPIIWTTIATGWPKEKHGIEDFTTLAFHHPTKNTLFPISTEEWPVIFRRVVKRFRRFLPFLERVSPNSHMRKKKAIWEILYNAGVKAGVVNWWCTYPPKRIDGYVVSDHANMVRMKLRRDLNTISMEKKEIEDLSKTVYPKNIAEELSKVKKRLSRRNI